MCVNQGLLGDRLSRVLGIGGTSEETEQAQAKAEQQARDKRDDQRMEDPFVRMISIPCTRTHTHTHHPTKPPCTSMRRV